MKVRMVICVIAALFVFSGASPWEGAAAIAPEGELPATGRYIATNSFPRNTIVDITNIETGRSTRVIVSNSLNSPGLLAIVSSDAAGLIGMRPGSVSRIRMIQPSDPIAYLRFTEGIHAGIPEYDSGNVVTENNLPEEVYSGDTYSPADEDREETAQEKPADTLRGPSYILEPEWEGQGRNIIDLPGYIVYPELEQRPAETVTRIAEETPREDERPQDEVVKDIARKIEETPNDDVIKEIPEYIAEASREETEKDIPEYSGEELAAEAEKEIPEYLSEGPREETVKDAPEYIAEAVREETAKDIPEKIEEAPREEAVKDIPERVEESAQVTEERAQITEAPPRPAEREYNLVPTQERPPQNNTIYGIDPSDIIPELAAVPPAREPARPQTPAVTPTVTPPALPDTAFSIPRIFGLDRGRYYVQIAALDSPESVEAAVQLIDRSYQPVVYKDGDNWYRLLLGPMNQGESAAVLQRFKSIGFKDAFVRRGG